MRLTIIKDDSVVVVDGSVAVVNCESLDPSIHAVQWDGQNGWIEFKNDEFGSKPVNEEIKDIGQFQNLIDLAVLEISKATNFSEAAGSEIQAAVSKMSIPPQPDPSYIYNPTTNAWEAP